MTDDLRIEDVKRLRLEPGDTLVLRVDYSAGEAVLGELMKQMQAAFPGHRTVVLAKGSSLEVVSAPDPEDVAA